MAKQNNQSKDFVLDLKDFQNQDEDYPLRLRLEAGWITLEKIKEIGERYLAFYERHKDWKPSRQVDFDEPQADIFGFKK